MARALDHREDTMTDRVHACLDGEIAREALSAEEIARLDSFEAASAEATRILLSAPAPDLTDGVMRRLPLSPLNGAAEPAGGREVIRRGLSWMWRPRTLSISLRPAYGAAAFSFAMLAALMLFAAPAPSPDVAPTAGMQPGAPRLYVQFRLETAGASRVELAGSFTDWEPGHSLHESTPGVWTVLVPLEPGVHDYTFVVDGDEWVVDPYAPKVPDSFGGSNSRLFLPAPAEI
jgi:hypothetical protein